jgi:hypothetical protein
MTDGTNQWTKWWWLRLDQIVDWSADEWRAFAAFMFIWTSEAAVFALIAWIKLRPAPWLVGFFIVLPLTFFGLRGITTGFFRNTITRGDDAAAARLSGRVSLPTNESWIRATWWIDTRNTSGTEAQKGARRWMMGISCLVLLFAFLMLDLILKAFGVSDRPAAIISLTTMLIPAFYAGRRISVLSRPELIEKADEDAIAQENRVVPPRT